jgi:hypothetical protein
MFKSLFSNRGAGLKLWKARSGIVLFLLCLFPVQLDAAAEPNLLIELNRTIINHFTDILVKDGEHLDGVFIDIEPSGIQVQIVFKKFGVREVDDYVWPRYRTGEIFKDPSERHEALASAAQRSDFRFAVRVNLNFNMSENRPDVLSLSFEKPVFCAYFDQDLQRFYELVRKRNELLSSMEALRSRLQSLEKESESLRERAAAMPDTDARKRTFYQRSFQMNSEIEKLRDQVEAQSGVREQAHELHLQISRFSSGSHFKELPSDELIRTAFEKFRAHKAVSRFLDLRLKKIENFKGELELSNLSRALSPYARGLKFVGARIVRDDSSVNHLFRLEGRVFRGEGK